jgi:Spy/CpxP family protein refolding chaperone
MRRRQMLTVLALGGILMTAALIGRGQSAGPNGHFGPHGDHWMGGRAGLGPSPHALQQYLQLNDTQKAASHSLHQSLRDAVRPLFVESRQLHAQIQQALAAASPDAAAIGRLMISAHAIKQQIRAAHDNYEKSFTAVLNADQATRYNTIREFWKLMRTSRPGPFNEN